MYFYNGNNTRKSVPIIVKSTHISVLLYKKSTFLRVHLAIMSIYKVHEWMYNVITNKTTEQQRKVKTKWRKRTGDINVIPNKDKGIMRRS